MTETRTAEPSRFTPFERVEESFDQVLGASTADETELVWFERRTGKVSRSGRGSQFSELELPRLTVLLRVVENGRQGWYRSDSATPNELESGLREAIAFSKTRPKAKKKPVLPTDRRQLDPPTSIFDPAIAALDCESALELMDGHMTKLDGAELGWSESHLAIFNSHGMRRAAAFTEASFSARTGSHAGAGHAAASARNLDNLYLSAVSSRAHSYDSRGEPAQLPKRSVPVLLAPEAVIQLLNVLNAYAFAGRTYLDGTSFLIRHRNVQVFDRSINLSDDGTTMEGMPFPFDVEGSPKQPLDLIVSGQPSTLALSRYQGAEAGLAPTAQAVGGQDSLFGNLFLQPGDLDDRGLLSAATGGVRIGWIEPPECFDPTHLHIRTIARGVRRIEDGALGEPLPDFVWQPSLLAALARLRGIGANRVAWATPTTPLGCISSPAIILEESEFGE